jgi:cobyrinic acid a,c-diamide synthase
MDQHLRENLHGIYISGGYQEVRARTLSENKEMLSSLRACAGSGRPLYAECGGLMQLSKGIETSDGQYFAILSLLLALTKMSKQKIALGFVYSRLRGDFLW